MTRPTFVWTAPLFLIALAAGLLIGPAYRAGAHCQVPCGIYDDPARIAAMNEDAATITKAIHQIAELVGQDDAQSQQQFVRWVNTKEAHASNILTVVSEYFLTQKVKPVAQGAEGYDAYVEKLTACHAVMVAAMKTKQHADPTDAQTLSQAIAQMASVMIPPKAPATTP